MKKFIFIICALLICILAVFSGCNNSNLSNGNIDNSSANNGLEPGSFNKTSTLLIDNFTTDYKIVIPQSSSKMESYAAEELQYFLYKSTNCEVPIITDQGLSNNNSNKYLSVGNTSLLRAQTDIKIDYAVMGENGPSIDTIGNTVYMCGAASYGILNSVYKFLEYQIGYKAYAYDFVDYNVYSKLYLLDFDYHYAPNVEWIVAHDHEVYGVNNLENAARLNLFGYNNDGGYEMFEGTMFNGLWCHTVGTVMPPESYPDAYNNRQLCFSDPDVLQIFCENLTLNYAVGATGPFIMIGGQDNDAVCNCSGCTEIIGKYGSGGLMSLFINKVADYVETYFEQNDIDKELMLVGLYYMGYTDIPVVDKGDGTYSPIDETVIPDTEGKVTAGACYAPMLACYTHPFGDGCCEDNKIYTEGLRKVAALTDNLFVYMYGSNFGDLNGHSYWFNNWSAIAGNLKFFEELGVRYVFDEANRHGISPFSSMRVYIRSRLAWDGDYDFNALVNEFTDAYYGLAAELMRDYFYSVMEQFQSIYIKTDEYHQGIYYGSNTKSNWPHQTILNFATILENAMHVIERSALSEKDKAIYYERIEREWHILKLDEYNLYKDSVDGDYLAELEEIVEEGRNRYTIVGQ